ncbi:MAG TPA: glycosyltransferase [Bryobacteraceae bacterium]|nr:glycosyltransferase [Bryobacteraceae bacterium]
MSKGNSITAVIPVHNRADLLRDLLRTVRAQSIAFEEVIVIDNGSSDSAPQLARAEGCTVIEMGENAGFARAVNRGWRAATTEWVAILNSDVGLDDRWTERLLAGAGAAAFATGLILDAAGHRTGTKRIDGSYDLVSRGACAWRAGHGEPAEGASVPVPIAVAPATACIFRRDVLARLNGFDEQFGSYLEDVDLGLRCLREGLTGVFVPDAVAWHHGSATLGRWNPRVVRLISRNQLMLVARHYDRALFWSCIWPILTGQVLWGLVAMRHGAAAAWVAGKWDAIRNFRLEAPASPRLREFLAASEREIRTRARDPYWKWYFRLTGAAH